MTAAVIGSDGDTAVLADAHGSDLEQVVDLLEQARAAHLLDAAATGRWQFRHQLIRDAVYARVTGSDLLRRHALVLEALAANPTTVPSTVAHHALAALPLFDADRAVALAARAGESAFAQHAYEEAVVWFSRALRGRASGHVPSVAGRAAGALRRGPPPHRRPRRGASGVHEAAELTDDPALLARAALGYADPGADLGIAYRTDDTVTAVLLERALDCQPSPDSVVTVQLEARLAAELYFSDEPSSGTTTRVRSARSCSSSR